MCPVCYTIALFESKNHYSCPICGWSGKSPIRKIMNTETSEEVSARTRELLGLRINNQLRYVEVILEDETRDDSLFEISAIFAPVLISGDNPYTFFVEGDKAKHVYEINEILGVEKVKIF